MSYRRKTIGFKSGTMKSKKITCPKCGSWAENKRGLGICSRCGTEWVVLTGKILKEG